MEKPIEDVQAEITASVKLYVLGKIADVEVTEDRIHSGQVFNDVMEAIGFKFVKGGDCRNCDAKFICERVEHLTNSFCFSYCGLTSGSYLGKH